MSQDFSGQNLRGRSFKGRNLAGANFSDAVIRGANFTNANLTGANFTGAKAGLQQRWAAIISFSWLFALIISVFLSGITSFAIAGYYFSPNPTEEQIISSVYFLLLTMYALYILFYVRLDIIQAVIWAVIMPLITIAIIREIYGIGFDQIAEATVILLCVLFNAILIAIAVIAAECIAKFLAVLASLAFLVTNLAVAIWVVAVVEAKFEIEIAAVLAVLALVVLGVYLAWRILRGDKKDISVRTVVVFLTAIGGTNFRNANLTDANFTQARLKSTKFVGANLTRTCFHDAEKLHLARVGKTILINSSVRELLVTKKGENKSLVGLNLQGANLDGAKLSGADFTDANLSNATLIEAHLEQDSQQQTKLIRANLRGANFRKAKLHYANLKEADLRGANFQEACLNCANLTSTKAVGTDFTKAEMTGTCLEAWKIEGNINIKNNTKLDQVECNFFYLREKPKNDQTDERERRPSSGEFPSGLFTKLFQEASETVELIFDKGVNWRAFVAAFKKLQVQNEDTELAIQSIENKGDGVVVVKVNVPPDANKEKIHSDFTQNYELALKAIEEKYKAELQGKDEQLTIYREYLTDYRQRYVKIEEIISTLAAKSASPINYIVGKIQGAMNVSDQSRKIEITGGTIHASGAGAFSLGDISGTVANTINQLPESSKPDEPGIKELLNQLKAAIETDSNLSEDDKKQALVQVQALAEAGKQPQEQEKQQQAKGAIRFFRGLVQELPTATKFVEACSKLIPAISSLFGLG